MVTDIANLAEFKACISDNAKVAIDFYATWCGPCQVIGPKFVTFEAAYPGIKFIRVDVDTNKETSTECGINAMPTFKFYHNGNEVEELVGASEEKLKTCLDTLNAK